MKKTTKSLLITSVILFTAGLLLALSSFLYVKVRGIDPYGIERNIKTPENKTVYLPEILSTSPNANFNSGTSPVPFSKIDMTSFTGDVVIRSTEEPSYLALENANTQNIAIEIQGETLVIRDIRPVGFFGIFIDENGFSFHGLRQIFGPGNSANAGRTVTVYVNSETELSQINVTSSVGDITVDGISAQNLDTKASLGDITIQNCTVSEGKITAAGSFSQITIDENEAASINVSSRFGTIHANLTSPTTQSAIFDLWVGKIRIRTDLPTTFYKLNLGTAVGKVTRNQIGVGKSLNDVSTTAKRISSSMILGSIALDFNGENEADYQAPEPEPETSVPETDEPVTAEPETAETP